MRSTFFLLLVATALSAGFASGDADAKGRKQVEIELIGDKEYRLDDHEYDYAGVSTRLSELDAESPIRKLVLIDPDGDTSIADIIDFALLAKPIGARAYHSVDGKLKEITVEIND